MLAVFLDDMTRSPFADGSRDCALTVADWVVAATGCADPADHLRGRYRTALGRERLLRRLGGLEAVMAECARKARLPDTLIPARGDVGLIRVNGVELAAICLGERWAIKSSSGLTVAIPEQVLRAWRVEHG